MKNIWLTAVFLVMSGKLYAQACEAEITANNEAIEQWQDSMAAVTDETQPDDFTSAACAGGTVQWGRTSYSFDVPEVTTRLRKWSMDIPETTMRDREMFIKVPITRCENKKTGQYPETRCEDTWIRTKLPFGGELKTKGVPKCTVTWSDIITKVCWPEMTDKRIVVGVPEFAMRTREFSFHNPEITMKTREFSMHVPKITTEEWCVGGGCKDDCENDIKDYTFEIEQKVNAYSSSNKELAIETTSELFSCQRNELSIQKDKTLRDIDTQIAAQNAQLDTYKASGPAEFIPAQEASIQAMFSSRISVASQFDSSIEAMFISEKEAIASMESGGN